MGLSFLLNHSCFLRSFSRLARILKHRKPRAQIMAPQASERRHLICACGAFDIPCHSIPFSTTHSLTHRGIQQSVVCSGGGVEKREREGGWACQLHYTYYSIFHFSPRNHFFLPLLFPFLHSYCVSVDAEAGNLSLKGQTRPRERGKESEAVVREIAKNCHDCIWSKGRQQKEGNPRVCHTDGRTV